MSKPIDKESWVWVIIQEPEANAQMLGQQDEENNISFIPTFLEKDEALRCQNSLVIEKGKKCEVQAILYEELLNQASESGFLIFILNGSGEVLDRINPLQ
ncbi:hypothetical protein [Desulfonema magnum]|uniref:Uncharacterized protein n=1 Tax=Desulfonema magnum TaxID=45655 RepID=A0A975BMM4_9BACT|nr:hypothetical protein [Desulfonema magnum]QTA88298.1 Uncharacterized protein dnm_043410 [Desulfonema magnum]